MAEPAFTTEQYNALNAAIAQGTLTVEYGDKKVTYRSLNEMLRIRAMMAKELGVSGKKNARKTGVFSKNWDCK
ncbi:MAG: hypothetical protein JSS64_07065 [Bacteroidetes bacterium]|nr:hypothetical protein [Bacteroidota bacterium]